MKLQDSEKERKGFYGLEAFFLKILARFKYAFDYTIVFSQANPELGFLLRVLFNRTNVLQLVIHNLCNVLIDKG